MSLGQHPAELLLPIYYWEDSVRTAAAADGRPVDEKLLKAGRIERARAAVETLDADKLVENIDQWADIYFMAERFADAAKLADRYVESKASRFHAFQYNYLYVQAALRLKDGKKVMRGLDRWWSTSFEQTMSTITFLNEECAGFLRESGLAADGLRAVLRLEQGLVWFDGQKVLDRELLIQERQNEKATRSPEERLREIRAEGAVLELSLKKQLEKLKETLSKGLPLGHNPDSPHGR